VRDLSAHIDYVRANPVKHAWAVQPKDLPYSTFHHYVRADLLPADWMVIREEIMLGETGEREPA
jgi:hypothetical protein